jgi:hypothetical protein
LNFINFIPRIKTEMPTLKASDFSSAQVKFNDIAWRQSKHGGIWTRYIRHADKNEAVVVAFPDSALKCCVDKNGRECVLLSLTANASLKDTLQTFKDQLPALLDIPVADNLPLELPGKGLSKKGGSSNVLIYLAEKATLVNTANEPQSYDDLVDSKGTYRMVLFLKLDSVSRTTEMKYKLNLTVQQLVLQDAVSMAPAEGEASELAVAPIDISDFQ